MSKIEKGDRVVVRMSQNQIFPWQTSPSFEAIYQSGPRGAGDVIKVTVPMDHQEDIDLRLNGNSSEFVAIRSLTKTEKSEVAVRDLRGQRGEGWG